LPYGLAYLFSLFLSPRAAMQAVVVIAVAAYPVGAWLFLRAQKKPAWLVLLALPLVYNRAFYWGFVNFVLAVGLAFAALSIVVAERKSWRSDVVLALLCLAMLTTHFYGVAFVVGYLIVGAVLGDRARFLRRLPALLPAILGALVWTLLQAKAPP